MKILFTALLVSFVFIITACSETGAKRMGYETLQNIRQQECYKTPSIECEKRETLEVYEERRLEVKQAD